MLSLLPTDAAIVQEVLGGRPQRFEVLVRKYMNDVLRVAWAYTRNTADAEDITQTTFLKAFEGIQGLREPKRFRHWMLTIARNEAHALWRKQQRESQVPAPSLAQASDPAQSELQALLQAQLAQLSPDKRELLLLHYYAGWSTREIAAHLNLSRDAVKKRLERARADLGARLLPSLKPEPAARATDARIRHLMGVLLATQAAQSAMATPVAGLPLTGMLLAWKFAAIFLAAGLGVGALLLLDRPVGEARRVPQATPPEAAPVQAPAPSPVESPALPAVPAPAAGPVQLTLNSEPSNTPAGDGVSLKSFAAERKSEKPRAAEASRLEQRTSIEFEKISLEDILGFMKRSWNLEIHLVAAPPGEQPEPVTDGMVTQVNLHDVPLWQALEELCAPLGLAPALDAGFVFISTPAFLTMDPPSAERIATSGIAAKMQQPVSLVFESIHLQEVIHFVADTTEVNLVLDARAVAPAPGPAAPFGVPGQVFPGPASPGQFAPQHVFPGPDGPTFGGSPGTASPEPAQNEERTPVSAPSFMVEYLNLRDLPLRDALRALLLPLELKAELHPEGIVIGTKVQLQQFNNHRGKLRAAPGVTGEAMRLNYNLELSSQGLDQALGALQNSTGLEILLDAQLPRPAKPLREIHGTLDGVLALLALHADAQLAVDGQGRILFGPPFKIGAQPEYAPLGESGE